jgi:hypothetical protein
MQVKQFAIPLAIVLSFGAGMAASLFVPGAIPVAYAATAPLMAQVIDVGPVTYDNLPPNAGSQQRSVTLLSTANGTVSVQAGTVRKHTHQQSEKCNTSSKAVAPCGLATSARISNRER